MRCSLATATLTVFLPVSTEVTVAPDGDGLPAGLVQRGVGLMEQRIEGEINATQDWRGLARCRRQAGAAHPAGMVEQEGDLEQASVADGGLEQSSSSRPSRWRGIAASAISCASRLAE